VKYTAIFTLILALYLLSFSFVSKELILPSLRFALLGLLFFPIFFLISRILKLDYLKRNLFLPLEVALALSILANLASIGSPPFFAVMFLVQVIALPFAFILTAYEFYREGLILSFLLSFIIWFGIISLL
jgi:hypothetical protein